MDCQKPVEAYRRNVIRYVGRDPDHQQLVVPDELGVDRARRHLALIGVVRVISAGTWVGSDGGQVIPR